jgi:hypothetical protein
MEQYRSTHNIPQSHAKRGYRHSLYDRGHWLLSAKRTSVPGMFSGPSRTIPDSSSVAGGSSLASQTSCRIGCVLSVPQPRGGLWQAVHPADLRVYGLMLSRIAELDRR